MDIIVDFSNGSSFNCPNCGKEVAVNRTENETWHHKDFFMFVAYLHARVPVVECSCCGINTVERPWAQGSRFTLI